MFSNFSVQSSFSFGNIFFLIGRKSVLQVSIAAVLASKHKRYKLIL